MSRKRLLCALLVSTCGLAAGADWLAIRGDAQRTGWQKDEKILNVRSVKALQLLWQRKLGVGRNSLTDPLLLGPIITHRGIKELVFAVNRAGIAYAVDADLGRIFWERSLPGGASCAEQPPTRPAMPASPEKRAKPEGDDDFSDGDRPLYVFLAGTVFALRPSTGSDFSPSFPLLPLDFTVSSLNIENNVLYASSAGHCGTDPERLWTLNLLRLDQHPVSQQLTEFYRKVSGNTPALSTDKVMAFEWNGTEWLAGLNAANGELILRRSKEERPLFPGPTPVTGGLAYWQEFDGSRWIYVAALGQLTAFRVSGPEDNPVATSAWNVHDMAAAGAPVVANGIVYVLAMASSVGAHAQLHAFDARDGKELYTSGDVISSSAAFGNLAVANGHLSFSAADGVLYCFGLPFEM